MPSINESILTQQFLLTESRTIDALCHLGMAHIYVWFRNEEIFDSFCQQAKDEGLKCGAQGLHCTDIVALQPDGSAAYCGSISHMAFGSGEGITGDIIRIDFDKFISGERDFLYRRHQDQN